MKRELAANSVSNIIFFNAATQEALEHKDDHQISIYSVIGRISKDGKWAWLIRDGSLEVVSVVTGERWASWCFGAVVKDPHSCVTCITEYHYDNSHKLLVALSTQSHKGMVCLFDLKQSKTLKAIVLPHKVTSIEAITTLPGSSLPHEIISEHLEHFSGIVALGTDTGRIFLLDMCLDDETTSNEIAPCHVSYITFRTKDVQKKRAAAFGRKEHLCIQLDDESHQYGQYIYRRKDNSVIRSYNSGDVYVSCLKFIHQLGSLAVGFNFGCFQIWSLQTPELEYSSRLEQDLSLVNHFTFQEPENDPRNCCYLWVGRSSPVTDPRPELCSSVSLFQLSFGKKGFEENYGLIYQGLQSCFVRFEHDITFSPHHFDAVGSGSRLIDCYTLENPVGLLNGRFRDSFADEEGIIGPDVSLAVFVWEAVSPNPGVGTQYFMGIFDMNRWYHAQMPTSASFAGNLHEQCSYFSFYTLEDVMVKAEPDFILDVYISSNSIRKYVSLSGVEQHFFPSSLAFETTVLLETGIIKATYLGLQRQTLAEVQKKGPACLVNPHDLYNLCLYAGMVPRTLESNISIPMTYQREALLSVALEHNMVSFLASCTQQWATGEFTPSGCSLRFFLEWAWKKVGNIKSSIDRLCIPLYDCSGVALSQSSIQILHQYKTQLQHIVTLFHVLLNQAAPTTEQGLRDLESKMSVVTLLSLHLQVVLWFLVSGLLPENTEDEQCNGRQIAYPTTPLTNSYSSKRQELQKLSNIIGETDILMIDGLTGQIGESINNLWEKEGGNGLYPPPSLHTLLNIYLLENVNEMTKHSIVMYLFLDLISILNTPENQQVTNNMNLFAAAFGIPTSQARLIQAFWMLDHEGFEEALEVLLDPSISSKDILPWQHTRIIKSFIYQCQGRLALKYTRVRHPALQTPESVKLHLTVLLDNGLITEAFEYQRLCKDQTNIEDILYHFFLACQQSKIMDKLLQLPLNELEERYLIQYLQESNEPHSLEILVMHYLQRGCFIEAIQLNEKLKINILNEHNPKTRERAITRNAIVDNYFKILPSIQQKLVFGPDRQIIRTKIIRKEVHRPLPLSTVIHQNARSQVLSQATLIAAVMEKVAETYSEPPIDYTPVKSRHNISFRAKPSPFIGTPLTPKIHTQFGVTSDVVYPTLNFTYFNRLEQPGSPKKIGFMGVMSPSSSSDTIKRRLSKHLNAEALSLLRTPPVHRKVKQMDISLLLSDTTHQSILKVKQALKQFPSPLKETYQQQMANRMSSNFEMALATPPKYERKKINIHDDRPSSLSILNMSKQLRFDLPSPESSTSEASPPSLSSLVNASPRKPLHHSPHTSENDQSMVVDEDITFTFHKRDLQIPISDDEDINEVNEVIPSPVHAYVCGTSDENEVQDYICGTSDEKEEVKEIIPPPVHAYICGSEDKAQEISRPDNYNIYYESESDDAVESSLSPDSKSILILEKENNLLSPEAEDTFLTASSPDSSNASPSPRRSPGSPGVTTRSSLISESYPRFFDHSPKSNSPLRSLRLASDISAASLSSEASISPRSEFKKLSTFSSRMIAEFRDTESPIKSRPSLDIFLQTDRLASNEEQSEIEKSELLPSDTSIFPILRRSPRNKTPLTASKQEITNETVTLETLSSRNNYSESPDQLLKSIRRNTRQRSHFTIATDQCLHSECEEPMQISQIPEMEFEIEQSSQHFTFSNPTILEGLSEYFDTPLKAKPFIFSPPITRSRSRHKKPSDDSHSDTSAFSAIDSDAQSGIGELKVKTTCLRRSPRQSMFSPGIVSESPINFISPVHGELLKDTEKKIGHRISKSISHGMTLRKNRGPFKKKRSSKLW